MALQRGRRLALLPRICSPRSYAIALPSDSPLRETLNRTILKIVYGEEWQELVDRYLST